jgi:hypothetical protein
MTAGRASIADVRDKVMKMKWNNKIPLARMPT